MTDVWFGGALLVLATGALRSSLATRWWERCAPGVLLAAWIYLGHETFAARSLGDAYGPLRDPDLLALVLMALIGESLIAVRSAVRLVARAPVQSPWRRMLAATPTPGQFVAVRLLTAHAFQVVPAGVGFEVYGAFVGAALTGGLLVAAAGVAWALPSLEWRVELYLLSRAILLAGIVIAFAAVSASPVPQSDASLTTGHLLLVLAGLSTVVVGGALLSPRLTRLRRRVRSPHLL